MENDKKEVASMELVSTSALESITKGECDVQVATSHAFPRSMERFKKRALEMVTFDLETAESCIYERPVGDGKTATGESIRMAEIVAASFQNLRVAARIIHQDERSVTCEGVAWDMEANYAGRCEVKESTVTKYGEPYSERMRMVAAKACLSKAYRDAVFRVVPKSMCKFLRTAAEQVINKEVPTLAARRKRAVEWVKTLNIEPERIWAALGIVGEAELGEDQLSKLTGLRTAVNDGDTTLTEAFPAIGQAKAATTARPVIDNPPPQQEPEKAAEQPAEEESERSDSPSELSVNTVIASVEEKTAKNGNAYFVVKTTERMTLSTFDTNIGEAAVNAKGADVTLTYTKDGKYFTLTGVTVL